MADDGDTLDQFRVRLYGATISTYAVTMIIVPLNIWGHMSHKRRNFGLEDVLTIFALLASNAFLYVCLLGMGPNLGKHVLMEVAFPDVIGFLKFLFAGQLLYVITLALIKYSILALYWILFSISTRVPILVVLFTVTAWILSEIFVVIFTCNPVQAQWDVTITDSTCIKLSNVYISGSTPNMITDIVMLILPITPVWRLRAPIAQRLLLGGVFMLGAFVCVVSIVRLVILLGIPLASSDTTYNSKEVIIWSIVEINVGLVCACLPSMKPVWVKLDQLVHGTGRASVNKGSSGSPPGVAGRQDMVLKKGRRLTTGLFSALSGLTRSDDEEDGDKIMEMHSGSGANLSHHDHQDDGAETDDTSLKTAPEDKIKYSHGLLRNT